jgi:hypothetical protein
MKPIKRAIALCWIMLVACFVVKLFGGNWFEVVCTNEHFLQVCEIVDNNKVVWCIVGVVLYIFPQSFAILSCSKIVKPNKNQVALLIWSLLFVWSLQFVSTIAKSIAEILVICLLPVALAYVGKMERPFKPYLFRGIIGCVLIFVFQTISMLIRNIGLALLDNSALVTFILLTDYYIMIALYYLYSINSRKE